MTDWFFQVVDNLASNQNSDPEREGWFQIFSFRITVFFIYRIINSCKHLMLLTKTWNKTSTYTLAQTVAVLALLHGRVSVKWNFLVWQIVAHLPRLPAAKTRAQRRRSVYDKQTVQTVASASEAAAVLLKLEGHKLLTGVRVHPLWAASQRDECVQTNKKSLRKHTISLEWEKQTQRFKREMIAMIGIHSVLVIL